MNGNNCTTCTAGQDKPYQFSGSYGVTNYTNTSISKNNLTLDGDMYTDRVCLAFNMNMQNGQNCVENFGFFVVEGS